MNLFALQNQKPVPQKDLNMNSRIVDLVTQIKGKGDLVVSAQGATIRIKADDLVISEEGICVRNTGINIRACDHVQLARKVPTNYPVEKADIESGRAIVLSYGSDRMLFSICQTTASMMAYLRAKIINEIENMARNDDMLLIGTSMEGESLHRTIDITVADDGIDLEGVRILNWSEINATHIDEHLLVSHGDNQILTFAVQH